MLSRSRSTALAILILLGFVLVPGAEAQDKQASQDTVETPDATVYVDGLACPFCAYGIEKKLDDLNAIQKMEVQLEEGRVLLAFKEGHSVTKDELRAAVENAGFTARKIEFAGEASVQEASAQTSSS